MKKSREKQIISQFEAMFPRVRSKAAGKLRPRVDVETWDSSPWNHVLSGQTKFKHGTQARQPVHYAPGLKKSTAKSYPCIERCRSFARSSNRSDGVQQVVDALDAAIAAADCWGGLHL